VKEDGRDLPIDTGFMVFNHQTYPLLCRSVPTSSVSRRSARTCPSASRTCETGYEWNGGSLDQVFGQRKNLLSPRFWRFMLQINRFNQETIEAMDDPRFERMTLGEYAIARDYGQDFLDLYVLPMGSAVWSTPPERRCSSSPPAR
jgi:predicted NAD/FAD-binding protein